MDRRRRQPADRPRRRQSLLARDLRRPGLVRTSDDFGAQGEPPSHTELLDWLAVDFRESGWDVKRLIKTMLLSATYRQSARSTPEKLEERPGKPLAVARPPVSAWTARRSATSRLRQAACWCARSAGPSVKPYQPDGVWSSVAMPSSNTKKYERDSGEKALPPQSLYLLETGCPAGVDAGLQRPDARALDRAPRAHQHAAAGAGHDERTCNSAKPRAGSRSRQ